MTAILCQWDGESFVPVGDYHARKADEAYVIGMRYSMAPVGQRSRASHCHYFAALNEAWQSLPDKHAGEPWAQSPEHLRRYALIRTGFCDTLTVAAGSNAAALRTAAAMRSLNEYALVSVEASTVHVFQAQSQSMQAMGKQRFEASKEAVLGFIADLLGVDRANLPRNEAA